jgi:hypothetical protein
MRRERALKVVLVVVGLIFCGLVYPLTMFVRQEPALAMMLSVYVTLGIFSLLAARDPSANRSLIAFHGMVELCPRRAYGDAGIPQSDPSRRTVGRGSARHHRRSPDRAGSGEVSGASIGSRCVGSTPGTADPDIPILKEPRRSTHSCSSRGINLSEYAISV